MALITLTTDFGSADWYVGTNVTLTSLPAPERCVVTVPGVRRCRACPVRRFYREAPAGRLAGILGATGFLELSVRDESAARKFGLRVGARVWVRFSHCLQRSRAARG